MPLDRAPGLGRRCLGGVTVGEPSAFVYLAVL